MAVGVFSLVVSATISILVDFPEPAVHDEFCYVLAGQTFAHGRLTNPKHPLWEFFETIYVIHDPTYQSKYPPGQGLVLAAGIALVNEPIVGVWLGTALACGAVTWMLLAWLLWMIQRSRSGQGAIAIKSVVIPCLLVLLPGAAWMGYYNWRVTGHALLTPYMRHDQIYGRTPHFVWQELRPAKSYNNPELDAQHDK